MVASVALELPSEDLRWLLPALWPDDDVMATTGTPGGRDRFLANPAIDHCRLLVPVRPARAAAQAVRRYHDGASTRDRVVMGATEAVLRLGFGRLLRQRHVTVNAPLASGLIGHLAEALDTEIGSYAVTLGPRRANRKPVVQLFTTRGNTVGFAKVAVDAYTDDLVQREISWLARARASSDPALHVPKPLWSGTYNRFAVSVIEPRWARRRPSHPAPPAREMIDAVHHLTAPVTGDARSSAPGRALARSPRSEARDALRLVAGRHSPRVPLGAWHGDLTPWNLLTTRSERVVIDWETAETGHPRGADALHYDIAVAMQLEGLDAAAALQRGLLGWIDRAGALGLGPTETVAVRDVLLLEYVRRDLDLEAAERPVSGLGAAALRELARG